MAQVILFAGLLLACGELRRAAGAPSVLGKFYLILPALGCVPLYFLSAQLPQSVTICNVSLLQKIAGRQNLLYISSIHLFIL